VNAASHDEDSHDEGAERPSKSARKRAALAARELGETLVRLSDAELAALGLPEALSEAIRVARRINSHAARARQRQYIGKLLRALDLQPIREALAARSARAADATERFRRIEYWRERLIAEGEPALAELASWRPDTDQALIARLVGAARSERARGGAAAARELFRALRALFATMP
jgi:ribosome-associated protein